MRLGIRKHRSRAESLRESGDADRPAGAHTPHSGTAGSRTRTRTQKTRALTRAAERDDGFLSFQPLQGGGWCQLENLPTEATTQHSPRAPRLSLDPTRPLRKKTPSHKKSFRKQRTKRFPSPQCGLKRQRDSDVKPTGVTKQGQCRPSSPGRGARSSASPGEEAATQKVGSRACRRQRGRHAKRTQSHSRVKQEKSTRSFPKGQKKHSKHPTPIRD